MSRNQYAHLPVRRDFRVKAHAKRCRVRTQPECRRCELSAWALRAKFRIGNVTIMAIRKAVMRAHFQHTI